MEHEISKLQDEVNTALLTGDWATLEQLIAPDARIIGPRGFMTDRDEWLSVHREAGYELVRFEPFETEVHAYGSAGVRIDSVESECVYRGETIKGRFRVTQSWVTDADRWQLAAIQYTALPV
jgi:Domain of unknown function (DUF4440)